MGVLGLWRLLDSTGKPVPLETLEGKVLAIDVSIWIHQVIQGYQDRQGNSLPNAHLIGLFNRICKLMYFKIKPVFVFDGGVPLLKKNTIATRRKLKSIATSKAHKLKNDLINNLIKHALVKGALDKGNNDGESIANQVSKDSKIIPGSSEIHDMYKLPDIPDNAELMDSDDYIDSDEENQHLSPRKQTLIKWMGNIHNVDVNTEEFKNLPADVRYDILTDLKETRKQNSWGRINELPVGSNNYSGFQVNRLLKRRYVQESLEDAEKEMGGKTLTLEELDKLLTDQGIKTTQQDDVFRIASDSKTRVIYLKDLDKCATQNSEKLSNSNDSNLNEVKEENSDSHKGCVDTLSIKSDNSEAVIDNMQAYDLDEDWFSDDSFSESKSNDSYSIPKSIIPKTVMNPALAYMLENSGLTRDQINTIVEQSKRNKKLSNSSKGSSKKASLKNKSFLKNRLKKKLFDSTFIDSTNIKKEIFSDLKSTSESNSVDKLEQLNNKNKKIKNNNSSKEITTGISDFKSNDFDEVPEKFNIKNEEIKSNDSNKIITMITSDSDSNDFEEVPEKLNIKNEEIKNDNSNITKTMEASDSDSNDFIEIEDVPIPEVMYSQKLNNNFQITIKADEELEDDIFADIFCNNTIKPNVESKSILNEIQEKIVPKSVINLMSKENLDHYEEGKDQFFSEKKKNEDHLITSNSNEIKTESTQKMDLLTPEKSNLNIEIKNIDKNYVNFENSTERITKTNVIEKNIETPDVEAYKNSNKALIIDDLIKNSEEQLNSSQNEKENNQKIIELPPKIQPSILPTDEQALETMKKQLEADQQQISGTLGKLERQATDVTDQMRIEAQELLKLFGIPYLVAPMEAEAQCAYLEQIKLTDGTITDDSDIWLFGGECVYKNFFDNNKKVLQFLANDIKHHFKLSRRELIQLALLVGSDYTNGLVGVGPVTALEILAAFPSDGEDILRGLRAFSAWFRAGKLSAPGKPSLRNKLKNVQIERGFPNQAVVQAYITPMIDESKEAFTWGKPNLILLADYAKKKFGWTKLKFDEIITPVMKKHTENKNQKSIDTYFKVHVIPKSIEANLSKRVQTAVQKIAAINKEDDELADDEAASTKSKKLKRTKKGTAKRGKKIKVESDNLLPIMEIIEDEEIIHIATDTNEKNNDNNIKITPKKIVNVVEDIIPQRERDKANALKSKLKAIEIFRKSKKGLDRIRKTKKIVKIIKEDADLSESNSSS